MSFLEKFSNIKALVALGLGTAVVAGIAYLVKNYNEENENSGEHEDQKEEVFDLDHEIQKLKASINMQNPSLEDIKKILVFSLEASKKEIFKFSKNFKKDRKKYNKEKRNQNLDQYLRMVAQGMTQIQQIGMALQQQIMMKVGISEQHFAKYQHQLAPFIQQQMMSQGLGSQSEKQLTLAEVKNAINLQIEYMQNHGDEMIQKLINTCSGWSQDQKGLVPTLISVYIADEVFEEHPEIDEDDLQGAQMKFQHHLQNEMIRLQGVMAPIMRKLTEGLGFGGFGGGFPGMDMGGMDMGMGGMDMGMGGMGQGPTMEQLQQLQQLRMQDPQAFEQLMQMMMAQGGMGMR